MKTETYILPSHWAPYLINGDSSNLTDEEEEEIDNWLKNEGLSFPLSCEDYGFKHQHDASYLGVLACDCQEYIFEVKE